MQISRRSQIDAFIVMDVMASAAAAEAAGRRIIHMEIGQPGTAVPAGARARLAAELVENPMGYTVSLGLPMLKERISNLYKSWYNIDLDPRRVVVTTGSSAGFILSFTALFDAGDRVALAEPGYPSYRQILRAMDLVPVGIPTSAENRFQPVAAEIRDIAPAGLIVASPSNPAGTMLDHDAMARLIDASAARGTSFISDEIYHGLHYGERGVSALEISDDVYVINSFSKYFSMTGWRIGWMVVPEAHIRTVERLAQNLFICAPHASQITAMAAMEDTAPLEAYRDVYRANRALMLEELPAAGFDRIAPPDGAFYIYADVSAHTGDSLAFAAEILDKAGVAVTPGLDFDPHRGHQTLRFSYAGSTDDIREGLTRLKKFMAARG